MGDSVTPFRVPHPRLPWHGAQLRRDSQQQPDGGRRGVTRFRYGCAVRGAARAGHRPAAGNAPGDAVTAGRPWSPRPARLPARLRLLPTSRSSAAPPAAGRCPTGPSGPLRGPGARGVAGAPCDPRPAPRAGYGERARPAHGGSFGAAGTRGAAAHSGWVGVRARTAQRGRVERVTDVGGEGIARSHLLRHAPASGNRSTPRGAPQALGKGGVPPYPWGKGRCGGLPPLSSVVPQFSAQFIQNRRSHPKRAHKPTVDTSAQRLHRPRHHGWTRDP